MSRSLARRVFGQLDPLVRLALAGRGGGGGGGVTAVTGTPPIASSGGATPAISIAPATDASPGSLSAADKTKLDALTLPLPLSELAESGANPGDVAMWDGAEWVPVPVAAGGVTSVTGTAPITSSGGATPAIGIAAATDGAAGSMSGADKTKLDGLPTTAWDYNGTGIPAAIVRPSLFQQPATAGGGQLAEWRTQRSFASSGATSGGLSFIQGKSDNANPNANFYFGYETAAGGHEPSTNYFGLALLKDVGGGVVDLTLGAGTDGAGTGVAGVEISCASVMNIATEVGGTPTAPINILPAGAGPGGGQTYFSHGQDGTTGLPYLVMAVRVTDPVPTHGTIRLPWATSTGFFPIITQRDSANTLDLDILIRFVNELYLGNTHDNLRIECSSEVLFEMAATAPATAIYEFNDAAGGVIVGLLNDTHQRIMQGTNVWPPIKDANSQTRWTAATNTTALQTIISVPITNNAITILRVEIRAKDTTGTGDFACFSLEWSYSKVAGVISAGAGAQPAATDLNHSTAAVGVAPQFAINGANIDLKVTPWSANAIHWAITVNEYVDTGTA